MREIELAIASQIYTQQSFRKTTKEVDCLTTYKKSKQAARLYTVF